jgi:iron complex outermembrane receptor protein
MGEVINIVTKLPVKEELQARIGAGAGDESPQNVDFAYGNRFASGLGISFAAGYRDSNGWRDSDYVVKTATAGGDPVPVAGAIPTTTVDGKPAYWVGLKGARPWDQRNAALRLDQELSPATRVTAGAAYSLYHTRYASPESFLLNASQQPIFAGSVTVDAAPARRVSISEADFITPTPSSERDNRYFARVEHDFGNQIQLRAQVGYFDHLFRFAQPVAATSRYASGAGEFVDQPNDRFDFDAQLRFPVTGAWFLIVGAAANRNNLDRLTYSASYWREFESRDAIEYEGRGKSRTYALFAQSELVATDWLALYAGGRVDWWNTEGEVIQNTAPAFDQAYGRRTDRQFSPKIAAVVTVHPTTTLRASWGTGFRPPTLLDLYSRSVSPGSVAGTSVVTDAAPDLKPEHVRAAEIGIESRLPPGTQISVAAFAQTLTDLIYRTKLSATLNQTINAGEAQVNGIEASVRQPLFDKHFAVFASATHLFRYDITRNAVIPASIGKVLTDVPQVIYSAGVEGERGPWSGSLLIRHVGHVFGSGDDVNANFAQGVFGSYDAYTVVNAKLAYRFSPHVQLSVAVDNLLNAQYFALQKQPGLTAFAELTLRY